MNTFAVYRLQGSWLSLLSSPKPTKPLIQCSLSHAKSGMICVPGAFLWGASALLHVLLG